MRLSKDGTFGALGIVVAALYWWEANDIQRSFLTDETGADGVPKMLAVALGVLGALVLIRDLASPVWQAAEKTAGHPHRRALGLLAVAVLYAALFVPLGYLAATALFIATAAAYAGQRRYWRLGAAAIIGSLALWLIFDRVFGVALPWGVWSRLVS